MTSPWRSSIRTRRCASRARRCIARWRVPSGRRACRATGSWRAAPRRVEKPSAEYLLWPPMRDQIFYADAVTRGGQRVDFGDNAYSAVDMNLGPEDPRPFVELAATLGQRPHSLAGGDRPRGLRPVGHAAQGHRRVLSVHVPRQRRSAPCLRLSPAGTRAGEPHRGPPARELRDLGAGRGGAKLRRRASTLSQRIEGWGNAKSTMVIGDPLEGVMSSAPGLALTSTANPSLALLGDALMMLPWNRTASPWEQGSVLFRRPDGGIWCYDPAGGRMRPLVVDIFVAPPGAGKSVLANTINIGLCLSPAVMGTNGAKLPLIGKADIGRSAEGFVRLDPGGARAATQAGSHLHLAADRPWLRVQPVRSAGRLRAPAAAGKGLPAELPRLGDAAARPIDAVRGDDAAHLHRHRRSLPALHRGRRRRQALPCRAWSRRSMPRSSGSASSSTTSTHSGATSWTRCATTANIGWRSGRSATPCRSSRTSSAPSAPTMCATCFDRLRLVRDQREGARRSSSATSRTPIRRYPDAQRADPARFRAGAHHRARSAVCRADRLRRGQPADRDDVPAGAAHSRAQLLPAPGISRLRAGAGKGVSPQALPRGLRDGQARGLRRVAPHAGQRPGARAGRARRPRGPQAQRAARLCRRSACPTWATASSRNRPAGSCWAPTISASARRSSSGSA